jgi:hypothetical protein
VTASPPFAARLMRVRITMVAYLLEPPGPLMVSTHSPISMVKTRSGTNRGARSQSSIRISNITRSASDNPRNTRFKATSDCLYR